MNKKTDDLNWLAFRYVANELEPAEVTEFELRFGEDQMAREAVARVVGQTAQAHASFEREAVISVRSYDRNWNHPASRVFVVAGSCLSLLLAVVAVRFAIQTPVSVAVNSTDIIVAGVDSSDHSTELALAWAETFDGDFEFVSVAANRSVESLDNEIVGTSEADGDAALVAPSWMLAALETSYSDKMGNDINPDIELQE